MVTTLLLISVAVAGFRPNDVEPVAVNSATEAGFGVSDFDKVLSEGDETQLVELLKLLNNWPKKAPLPTKIDYQKKRIAIADRLLELDCTEVRRQIAAASVIEASSSYYGLDFLHQMNLPEARQALESAATRYLNDNEESIRRAAKLAMAKLRIFEYAKSLDKNDLELAKESVFDVIDSFPDNQFVVDNVRLLLRRVFYDDIENGRQFMNDFTQRYVDSPSRTVQDLALELSDTVLLSDSKYAQLIANRWADGEPGQEKLLESSLALIGNPRCGTTLLDQVSTTMGWFEQIHEFDKARKICDAMIAAAPKHPVPEIGELAMRTGKAGLQRLAMVDKKINLEGETSRGQLKPGSLVDRIVIAVFVSQSDRSTLALKRLLSLKTEYETRGVELIAVSVDNELSDELVELLDRNPITCVLANDSQSPTNPILEQFPVLITPYVIIVDHLGIVRRINVQLVDVRTYLDEYIADRRRGDSEKTNN
jgi:tetratricopeptide (TPR) repeat protein